MFIFLSCFTQLTTFKPFRTLITVHNLINGSDEWVPVTMAWRVRRLRMEEWSPIWKVKKGKAVPLQALSGLEGSTKLRFPDFVTTEQDGGKFVSPKHRPPLPPGNAPGTHFC